MIKDLKYGEIVTSPEGYDVKLIQDRFNGDRWLWKYFDSCIGRWFDYGSDFGRDDGSKQRAIDWMNNGGCTQ